MSERSRGRKVRGSSKVFAGRYTYVKPLGRGAGGSVYLAEDLREKNREVALKVLSAEACETVQGKMLRREFEILSKLDHPNLVRVYDYGKLPDGGVFLAEEYIDGFSLQDARALLEPAALIDLTLQLLHGLAYLHAMGMIHRDIKPANVMLLWLDDASARPMVKLVDFGLSSMDPKRDTLRGGTRSYMAPEVIRGEKGERRSDLYSLGVTLYYALCGVLPFGPRTKEDPPPTEEDFRPPDPHRLNTEVPLELSRFTMALLRQVPDVDYADAGEALQALAADAGALDERSVGRMANSLDLAAAPVIRGYFERGVLSRRIEEDDLLVEWLSMNDGPAMGQLYLIRGEPGIGKSRLLQDVQASSKLSGHIVLFHRCGDDTTPYGLLLAMVEQLVEVARSQDVIAIERYNTALHCRRLLSKLGFTTPGDNVAAYVEQAWMRKAIEDAVSMLSPGQVVFFIDDIDRADDASLEIITEWFRSVKSQHRPNVVATAKKGEVYSRLSRGEGVQILPIEGINKADVKAFFCEQLGISGLSDAWLESVALASQGRPAYIEELCRYLIDTGMLRRATAKKWSARVKDIEAAGVPGSLRESLRRRVTSVGAGGRECLELLSLLDRRLAWKDARSLLKKGGSSSEEAERTLRTVNWRHLVSLNLTTGGRYIEVIHRELTTVVADMLSPEWRRALHRRVGELIADQWKSGRGDAGEAAKHLKKGGRDEEAAPFFEIAGDVAHQAADWERAVANYQLSLEGIDDPAARALLTIKLARTSLAFYKPVDCRRYLKKAVELIPSISSSWLIYRVYLDAGQMELAMGSSDASRGYLEKLQRGLPELASSMEAMGLDGALLVSHGRFNAANKLFARCVELYEEFGTIEDRASALRDQAHLDVVEGRAADGLRQYEEALGLMESVDNPAVMGSILGDYGADLRRIGSPVEAREVLQDALTYHVRGSSPQQFVEALFQLAWTLTDMGSSSTARSRANEAYRFAQLLGHQAYEQKVALLLGSLILKRRNERDTSADRIERVVEAFERRDDFVVDRAEVLIALGKLMINLKLTDQGPKVLQRGRQLAFRIGATGLLPPVQD